MTAPRFFPTNGGAAVVKERLQYFPIWVTLAHQRHPVFRCDHCQLEQSQHINDLYCPEWRLRQMDGDR